MHGKGDTCNMHRSFVVNDVLISSVIITAYARGLMSVTICLDSKTSYHTKHTHCLTYNILTCRTSSKDIVKNVITFFYES